MLRETALKGGETGREPLKRNEGHGKDKREGGKEQKAREETFTLLVWVFCWVVWCVRYVCDGEGKPERERVDGSCTAADVCRFLFNSFPTFYRCAVVER